MLMFRIPTCSHRILPNPIESLTSAELETVGNVNGVAGRRESNYRSGKARSPYLETVYTYYDIEA